MTPKSQIGASRVISFVRGSAEADLPLSPPFGGVGLQRPHVSSPGTVHGNPVYTLNAGFQPGPWGYGPIYSWGMPALMTLGQPLAIYSVP
jgi:hypothetical protein